MYNDVHFTEQQRGIYTMRSWAAQIPTKQIKENQTRGGFETWSLSPLEGGGKLLISEEISNLKF
jgi:hypothetical protein